MRVESLAIDGVRCLAEVAIEVPAAGAWFFGGNGAGKTSVLEAVCLLGFGRSFRGRVSDGLIRHGAPAVQVVACWVDDEGRRRVSGLRHEGDRWEGRMDGEPAASLSQMAASFPVLCFHPESSQLVVGPADERRRSLDWLAFHVEPRFAEWSSRYARALRHRNALLRAQAQDRELDAWEAEMGIAAATMTQQRAAALALWEPSVARIWPLFSGGSGEGPRLDLRTGWRHETPLADLLLLNRARDRELGYTTIGPQRADLDLGRPFGASSAQLSRGQAKLLALALQLAQAEALRQWSGARSLLLLDDLQAELDPQRQSAVLDWVQREGYQAFITGTTIDPALSAKTPAWSVFHVERGAVTPATLAPSGLTPTPPQGL